MPRAKTKNIKYKNTKKANKKTFWTITFIAVFAVAAIAVSYFVSNTQMRTAPQAAGETCNQLGGVCTASQNCKPPNKKKHTYDCSNTGAYFCCYGPFDDKPIRRCSEERPCGEGKVCRLGICVLPR